MSLREQLRKKAIGILGGHLQDIKYSDSLKAKWNQVQNQLQKQIRTKACDV